MIPLSYLAQTQSELERMAKPFLEDLASQTGETANGVDPLIDRQHPHDLFMELSGSYAYRLTDKDSVFIYAGLPGEPAFGPPAFMPGPNEDLPWPPKGWRNTTAPVVTRLM